MGSEIAGGVIDRSGYEKKWANEASRLSLSSDDKSLWSASRYTMRPFVYFDKILIAWDVVKGEPRIKNILNVIGMDASFQDGIWVKLQSKTQPGADILITHTPRRLPGLDVFAWVPYFVEVRFVSADWETPNSNKNLRLSACLKMRERPDSVLRENCDYISELHSFRAQFPKYASTRF